LELDGEPVIGGAMGFGGEEAREPEGGLEMLGIGLVTAVDQAGGALETGTGSIWIGAFIGNVVAAEMFGLAGTLVLIFVEEGLAGRGGRLMRRVSRFGAFGSAGLAGSAIIILFYSYFGKCSMAKFAIVTYLWG
jgi:hypothetical protein